MFKRKAKEPQPTAEDRARSMAAHPAGRALVAGKIGPGKHVGEPTWKVTYPEANRGR